MIKRKIENELEAFYCRNGKEALLIDGARQVGKTFIVREFAKRHYNHFIELNFVANPELKRLFHGNWNVSEFFVKLSAVTDEPLIKDETLIFFDEVQECPEVVTYIKFLVNDARFHYILSGALLGVELKDIRSEPVGYLREVKMFPLDFEEFVKALGIKTEIFEHVRDKYLAGESIDEMVHARMMKYFRLYLVIGGMPSAVQTYIDTNNLSEVVAIQKGIIKEYGKDAAKYDRAHKLQIQRILDLIPAELNAKNKRFYVNDIRKGEKFERLEDNFVWLTKADIAIPVFNTDSPCIPLKLAKKANLFKLFMNDVGLLAAQYMDGIQLKILDGEVDVNFGAVYENFAAQELHAHGFEELYFFNSKKHGELDFLITKNNIVLPLEIKSGDSYRQHTALDNIMSVRDFCLSKANIYSKSGNIEIGKVSYYPIYSLMFLKHDPMSEKMIYKIDSE